MSGYLKPDNENDKLSKALSGDYNLKIRQVFGDSITAYKQHLGLWLRVTGLLMLIGAVSMMLLINILNIDFTSVESMQSSNAGMLDIIMLIIMAPLLAGYRMIGVKLSAGQPAKVADITLYFSQTLILVTANLLISLVMQIGLSLFVLPGIYVFIVTQFAVVIIADRRTGLFQAMTLSVKVVNRYLLPFTLIFLIFVMMMALVFLTFGFAILWVGPMYSLVMGRLYTDLLGHRQSTSTSVNEKDSILDA